MEEREENPHERLKQQLSELEQEWTAMKTGKSSSAVSWISMEEALDFVDNSPRKLMLSLQQDQTFPETEMIQIKSPFRRKLFHDSDDDETKTTSFSPSSCWSSNVMRMRDCSNKNKKTKKSGSAVFVSMVMLLLLLVLVLLFNGFDHVFMNNRQIIDTLVPT